MSRDWNETPPEENLPQEESEATRPTRPRHGKVKTTLDEALTKIPTEARDYLREKFKSDFHLIRLYEPSLAAKDHVVEKQQLQNEESNELLESEEELNDD